MSIAAGSGMQSSRFLMPLAFAGSTTHNKIDLNRWDNGKVICEMMEPIDVSSYTKDNVRELATYCHDLMEKRIAELDAEIAQGK